jgi:LysR family transcriptional regulator for metE and metH
MAGLPNVRLDTRDLRLALAITDSGSVTRAGHQLHLTQSAVSHQLADLERRLGGQLFERSGRRMIPTRLGEHLATRARTTLAELESMERDLVGLAQGRVAVLKLTTECYTVYHWLPPVLTEFRKRHPSVEVRLVPEATTRSARSLVAGDVDLCIAMSRVRDRRVRSVPLFDDELLLVVSAEHPLATRQSVSPTELRRERFLAYSAPGDNFAFRDMLAPAGVSASQISVLKLTEGIIELVRANMGVAILARWAVSPYLEGGTLRAVRIDHPTARRTWYAATRVNASGVDYLTDFVGFLRKSVDSPPRGKPAFSLIRSLSRHAPKRRTG